VTVKLRTVLVCAYLGESRIQISMKF